MPDAKGNIKGIFVPELPWEKRQKDPDLSAWEEARQAAMKKAAKKVYYGGSRSDKTIADVADKIVEAVKADRGRWAGTD